MWGVWDQSSGDRIDQRAAPYPYLVVLQPNFLDGSVHDIKQCVPPVGQASRSCNGLVSDVRFVDSLLPHLKLAYR